MYFEAVKWLIALILVLCIVYVYPLVENIQSDGWAKAYVLTLDGQVDARETPWKNERIH